MARFQSQPERGLRLRSIAWVLLLCVLLPFAQSAYGATRDPEAGLPACCRMHGQHKCFLRTADATDSAHAMPAEHAHFGQARVSEKCPCLAVSPGSASAHLLGLVSRGYVAPLPLVRSAIRNRRSLLRSYARGDAHAPRGPPASTLFA